MTQQQNPYKSYDDEELIAMARQRDDALANELADRIADCHDVIDQLGIDLDSYENTGSPSQRRRQAVA